MTRPESFVSTNQTERFYGLRAAALSAEESVGRALRALEAEGLLALPACGSGRTGDRFAALLEVAAVDLSLARLVEGHVDAIAIVGEAEQAPVLRALYGVWAADSSESRVIATRETDGFRLRGTKRYASGARLLDRALVTAHSDEGLRLFDVDLRQPGVASVADSWAAVGMASSGSLEVHFDVLVPRTAAVGEPGFYLSRRGFWHGAIGVAACWVGGAVGCARMLEARFRAQVPSEHAAAHFGAILADCKAMQSLLDGAGRDIDASDAEDAGGEERALVVRQVVEQGCQRVLAATGRASGSSPLAFDAAHARRAADLVVYLRQHHAERDLVALARLASAVRS